MKKEEAIQKVLEMIWSNQPATKVIEAMHENELTPAEVVAALHKPKPTVEERFDLLCEIEGQLKRVPFEEGRELNPKGIFPRNKFPVYLCLEETGKIPFPELKDKERLMDENLCILIQEVRHELNDKLCELGASPLRGPYWLDGHELSGIGYWVGEFYEGQLKVDYYDCKYKAKVRFIGRLQS